MGAEVAEVLILLQVPYASRFRVLHLAKVPAASVWIVQVVPLVLDVQVVQAVPFGSLSSGGDWSLTFFSMHWGRFGIDGSWITRWRWSGCCANPSASLYPWIRFGQGLFFPLILRPWIP